MAASARTHALHAAAYDPGAYANEADDDVETALLAGARSMDADDDPAERKIRSVKPIRSSRWRYQLLGVAVLGGVLLALHLCFVLLLRKTSFELRHLTVPDLCHYQSNGEVVVRVNNPSYCTPRITHLEATISKNGTTLLRVAVPAFDLHAGGSTLVSTVAFELLASPRVIHELVFVKGGEFAVTGHLVVRISCLLVPFSITLDLAGLPSHHSTKNHLGAAPVHAFDGDQIKKELDRLVNQIFKTIALSHIHTESDDRVLFAFTDVSFTYLAPVVWNLPAMRLQLQTDARDTILNAGFKRFLLGNGQTFISAFTEIHKNETAPLQHLLQAYLGGDDVGLHVRGSNTGTQCLSLQLLDLIDVRVNVPAKIDGQPALLRHYSVLPTLVELDSKTHTCLLQLDVTLTLHNPLPIHFELFELAFDLLYRDSSAAAGVPATFVTHIDDVSTVAWAAHDVHNVSLSTAIRDFATCKDLIGVYLRDQLVFALDHGRIRMAAGSGNLSIPFEVPDVPIHPVGLTYTSPTKGTQVAW